jgi:rare lipoprotein A
VTRSPIAQCCAVPALAATALAVLASGLAAPARAATADAGPSLSARAGGLLGATMRFRGTLGAAQAGRTVEVQRLQPDGTWAPAASAPAGPDGSFLARWRADAIGQFTMRAIVRAAGGDAQAADAPPQAHVTIFRPARATWYGPGLYGQRTACGPLLTDSLLGVAHRTLPCGTPVTLFYEGRSVTVPVVDRGPFGDGARYDLTQATAEQLGMTQTSVIGVMPQRGASLPAAHAPAPAPEAATGGVGYGG